MSEERTVVDLDVHARPELVDDDEGLALLLADDYGVTVRIALSGVADPAVAASGLAWRILRLEGDVRAKTVGYAPPSSPGVAFAAEHNAHTGPGVYRPIPRPLGGPALMQQDPPGWT